ncbi:PAS domain-containing protein [Roseovarius spongiae]|uniref:PAS domain-containing protein n=1 Tax=Roseovarius spongiae TaxID=2320272 RepID=A0A3A8ARE8_9RHOB|nr:PAS-domain containing protein [Roseovarius spongiae]RKF13395.1 PAS domain-containing protein [Roseovarius spongiae]
MFAGGVTMWIGLALVAAGGSLAALWLIGLFLPTGGASGAAPPARGAASFLFEDGALIDHDAGALPDSGGSAVSWSDLRNWLTPRFPGLPANIEAMAGESIVVPSYDAPDDGATVELTRTGDTLRAILSDPPHACPAERHAALAEQARLAELRRALQAAPYPIWKTAADGTLIWRNAACAQTFESCSLRKNVPSPDPGHTSETRFSIPGDTPSEPRWFEVQSAASDGHVMHHAAEVTKIVRAETGQRNFLQTLTKTFAYLAIGLAVFDKNRQLALFNPALVDLTGLPPDFLSARPELMRVFDMLRDRQVMPEPRNYACWRTQVNEVIESARDGLYQETWSLPDDVTYRVTGRPHPDGAVAFLFEDITAEVLGARRYRAQLDLRQSALDALPEAVMVTGPNGVLSFCNEGATRLLGIDPDSSFADMGVTDLVRACDAAIPQSELWTRVEQALRRRSLPTPLRENAHVAGRGAVSVRVEPLPGGARMLILDSDQDAGLGQKSERLATTMG